MTRRSKLSSFEANVVAPLSVTASAAASEMVSVPSPPLSTTVGTFVPPNTSVSSPAPRSMALVATVELLKVTMSLPAPPV